VFCCAIGLEEVFASVYPPGAIFSADFTIENPGPCDIRVIDITKSWNVTNSAIDHMNFPGAYKYNSVAQSGSVTYPVNKVLPAHSVVPSHINYFIKSTITYSEITSSISWTYSVVTSGCTSSGITSAKVVSDTVDVCGNSVQAGTEECDDGNIISGDGCSDTCQEEVSVCGNGILESWGGETCDDGNIISGDGCSATCIIDSSPPVVPPGGGGGGGGGGGTSSGSGGSGTPSGLGSSSTSTPSRCNFDLPCDEASLNLNGKAPVLITDNGEVRLALDSSNPSDCLDKSIVCVQVGSTPIVADRSQDVRGASFSGCLPETNFDIIGRNLFIPSQNKTFYKIRAGTPITSGVFGDTCYFDTRIRPIGGTGIMRSQQLGAVSDSAEVGDDTYSEVRTLMNPRVERILQPFHERGSCSSTTCSDGSIVDFCGCDATGNGVVISNLDARSLPTNYLDRSNSSADRTAGENKSLIDCSQDNVVFFDSPSGGSVTLDAPGDNFVLPPYPITLVVRGADLRIADNLVYPDNSEASLGVILLEKNVCGASFGGDAFLHPKPTNVVGAYYLEGSVKSTDQNWNLPTNRESTSWYTTFKNQILWEGTILSRNTIGGAVDPNWPRSGVSKKPSIISGGFQTAPWSEAVEFDLAYLREYFQCGNRTTNLNNYAYKISGCNYGYSQAVSGGSAAANANSGEAVVVRYDSRIQNNPPPGFDSVADVFHEELGL